MPKCIYCREKEANSEEHAIPAAVGTDNIRGFKKLLGKLCKECNQKIGQIEEQFLRCGPEAFFRKVLNIKGRKKHDAVNIFHRGSSSGKPIRVELENPGESCNFLCEPSSESGNLTFSNHLTLRNPEGEIFRVVIPDNINTVEELIEMLRRKEMADYEFVSVYIEPERKHIVEALPNLKQKQLEWENVELGHKGTKTFNITCEYTEKYFQGIAKIAFHYFLQYFERYDGHEKEFDGIKNFILNGGNVKDWVIRHDSSYIEAFKGPLIISPDVYGHFIVAEDNGEYISVKLMFFAGPKGINNMHHEVRISNKHSLIYRPRKSIGHQILYFNEKDCDGNIGEMKKLIQLDKGFISSLRFPRFDKVGSLLRKLK